MRILFFPENTELRTLDEATVEIAGGAFRARLGNLSPPIWQAFQWLKAPGMPETELLGVILEREGQAGLAKWWHYVRKLSTLGALAVTVSAGDAPWVTVAPTTSGFELPVGSVTSGSRYVLSRFALLRSVGSKLTLESPLCFARAVFHDARATAALHALATGATAQDLPEDFREALPLLASAGLVRPAERNDETSPTLESWEFHDLLFHARTRVGRQPAPLGATYPMLGKMPIPPALKPPRQTDLEDLDRPTSDDALDVILDRRRSLRAYSDLGITRQEVGMFLHRVARAKSVADTTIETPRGPLRMEFASRPYPSGGALYELEVYLAVNRCQGLAAGLYHYEPRHHQLERLSGRTPEVAELLRDSARSSATDPEKVQVLVILASRFARISWKYSSIAYATTLKNVGALYQTMYLVATAMDLAPCGIGAGNSDLFSKAAGTNYYEETSVGEFLLGRPA
jgi:SagB-type dehydrogenase family enzyme